MAVIFTRDVFSVYMLGVRFAGLNLFGEALKDVVATLVQCEETDLAEKITKFIEDLVACTECKAACLLSHPLSLYFPMSLVVFLVSLFLL